MPSPSIRQPFSHGVLVAWGDPPAPLLEKVRRSLQNPTFSITTRNRASFEGALRMALGDYFGSHRDIARARMIRIASAADLRQGVDARTIGRLIYYGDALPGALELSPSPGQTITAEQIADILWNTAIRELDILGCQTTLLAAELAVALPAVRLRHLRRQPTDDLEVDPATLRVTKLVLDPSAVARPPR